MSFLNSNENQGNLLAKLNSVTNDIEEMLKNGEIQIPVLPIVAVQVMRMTADENADLSELSDLIYKDQALAGHVLRLANSAYFGASQPANSLNEAINRLGTSMVGEIATIISIKASAFKVPAFKEDVENIWHHAVLSGFYGKEIANTLNHDADIQFLCGLLHTIGKPILYQMICHLGATQFFQEGPYYALRDLVKRLHCMAGEFAADRWHLPLQVKESCGYYKDRWDAKEHRLEVGMTLLSSKLADWCETQNSDLEKRLRQDRVIDELDLDSNQMEMLLGKRSVILRLADQMRI